MGKSGKDQLGNTVEPRSGQTHPPAVILVRPQLGENIGGAARAMLNFGLTELRLVKPRDGWPSDAAQAMAAGATSVLETAKLYENTEDAVADLNFIMAATARRRELEIPVVGTQAMGQQFRNWQSAGRKTGILFGPEKAGLTNEDIVLADMIVSYPINPAFQSLNLAQAVGVFSYIWAASESAAPPPVFQDDIGAPARRADLLHMFEHLEEELQQSGFFHPPAKSELMRRNIRAPYIRAQMTEQEVRTMRGIIKALAKGRGQKHKDED